MGPKIHVLLLKVLYLYLVAVLPGVPAARHAAALDPGDRRVHPGHERHRRHVHSGGHQRLPVTRRAASSGEACGETQKAYPRQPSKACKGDRPSTPARRDTSSQRKEHSSGSRERSYLDPPALITASRERPRGVSNARASPPKAIKKYLDGCIIYGIYPQGYPSIFSPLYKTYPGARSAV